VVRTWQKSPRTSSLKWHPSRSMVSCIVPHEVIQSPPSGRRPPWTKNIRSLQDPLWVWQGLHWPDRPFRGHHVKGASTAHPDKTAVAEYTIGQGHRIQFHNSSILAMKETIYIYIYIYVCVCVCVYTHTHFKNAGIGLYASKRTTLKVMVQNKIKIRCNTFYEYFRELLDRIT
jgi:hypothetical protein